MEYNLWPFFFTSDDLATAEAVRTLKARLRREFNKEMNATVTDALHCEQEMSARANAARANAAAAREQERERKRAMYERGPALLEAYGDCLTDRERLVITRILAHVTQVAVGAECGIGAERVRHITWKAMRKLLTAERVQQKRGVK